MNKKILIRWFFLLALLAANIFAVINLKSSMTSASSREPHVPVLDEQDKERPEFLETPKNYLPELNELSKVADFWPKLPYPEPNEWLANFKEEEQTVADLLKSAPDRAKDKSKGLSVIPIQPLDPVTLSLFPKLERILEITYQCPVRRLPQYTTPKKYYFRDGEQINASELLDHIVSKRPADCWAMAGITSYDMSTPDLNFVFGLSSFYRGVNLSSSAKFLHRNDQVILRRIAGTLIHEVGHSLGIGHCLAYSCIINGANNLAESDSKALLFCPHCMAKLKALRGIDPEKMYRELAEYYAEIGLKEDAEIAKKAHQALSQ